MTTPEELPGFSIVIPTYHRPDTVARTLEHLLACDYPSDRFEILVADNSTDETPQVVESIARDARAPVRLLWSQERLPAVKRNQALRAAAHDYVLFMNDDLWVRPDFLREHAATHAAHDEPIAVLGHCEQSPQMEWTPFIEWYQPFAYYELSDRHDQPVPWLYSWSMNLSFPREVMLRRQLWFHEDWAHIGHEDIELGYRWTSAGNQIVYNPRAWGEHYHPHSLDSASRLQESIGRGLRDLEVLIPEPDLLERYGVFSWRNSPRKIARGLVRKALFNRLTVPPVQRWLGRRPRNTAITRWLYWKVLLFHTERGYQTEPPRNPTPVPFLPDEVSARG